MTELWQYQSMFLEIFEAFREKETSLPNDGLLIGMHLRTPMNSLIVLAHTYDIVIERPYLLFPQLNSTGILVVDLGKITVRNEIAVDKAGQLADTIRFIAQGANAAVAEVIFFIICPDHISLTPLLNGEQRN